MKTQYFYLAVLAGYAVMFLLTRKEELPEDGDTSAIRKPFRRAASCLYRLLQGMDNGRHGVGHAAGSILRQENVTRDLNTLDPSGGPDRRRRYTIDKMAAVLMFGLIAAFLALAICSSREEKIIRGRYIAREDYGGNARDITAIAREEKEEGQDDSAEGTYTGSEYVIHVEPREYTRAQTDALAQEVMAALPAAIRGNNADLSHVNSNLSLMTSMEDYPFRIDWESSDYSLIDADGTVMTDVLEENDDREEVQAEVTLTAHLTSGEYTCETTIPVIVVPRDKSAGEQEQEDIAGAIAANDEASREDEYLTLPQEVNGVRLLWEEQRDHDDVMVFVLIAAAGLMTYALSDQSIHRQVEKRDQQMRLDYPEVVSRMVLFLGAGMSVRNVFYKLGQDYEQIRQRGGEKRYVYEEILLVCHELDSGVSQISAYTHLGTRCGLRQYTKLCSLLTQNIRKGNSELLRALQDETEQAYETRRRMARQMGEEAGTKLLLPMVMMLVITLVIIIIPAFFGFS